MAGQEIVTYGEAAKEGDKLWTQRIVVVRTPPPESQERGERIYVLHMYLGVMDLHMKLFP